MQIKTKELALELDGKTGAIAAFRGITGCNYIEKQVPLVRLSLLNEKGERTVVETGECAFLRRAGKGAAIRWENIGGLSLSAEAEIFVRGEGMLGFRLKTQNASGLQLECIQYPCIVVRNRLSPEGYKLFWPAMEGCEIVDVNFRTELMAHADGTVYPAKGWQGVYPGACPMQFMAYYNGVHGMYFASHDEGCRVKLVEWCPEEGGIRLIQQVYVDETGETYAYDYDVALGVFRGDWYDAAEIYRDWIQSSSVLSFPRLKDNKDLPAWLLEPLTVITFPVRGHCDTGDMSPNCYYPYTNILPYVRKYEDFFGNRQMVLLMHWEGTAPWAPPYVWPPFGDKAAFDALEKGIHERGSLFGLYCSGLGWTQRHYFYDYNAEGRFEAEGMAECVEVGPTQQLQPTTTCFHIREGYDLCPACEKVKALAVSEAKKIAAETDIDYLQFFDQDLGGNTYPCYGKSHPHPPAPGRWMAKEMADIADKMRAELRAGHPGKKVLIGCEAAACEPLLDAMRFNDLRYNLDLMYGIPVPAYAFVFGEYVMNYMGNHTTATRLLNTKLYPDNIFYRTAYSFVQGDILTFMCKNGGKVNWEWNIAWDDENEPDQEEYLSFAKMLNDLRNGPLFEVLRFGRMVKPRTVHCGKYTEKVDRSDLVRIFDEIVTARFTTEEGKDVQIFVNFNRRPVAFRIGGEVNGTAYRTAEGERAHVAGSDPELDMPAHSALVIEYGRN